MPELPEVEVTRRALAPHVEGRVVRAVYVRDARLRWPVPARLPQLLAGQRVERLDRRGKYLLWRFPNGTLISHLGMSGSWRILFDRPLPGVHDHADIEFAGRRAPLVRLTDPRRFGALLWHPASRGDPGRHVLLANLGVEPFDARFDGALLYAGTRGRRAPIKQVLLAGDIVVGVGNIYASESLFRAAINPKLPAYRLGPARCARLADAVRDVLNAAIRVGGSTLRDFIGADGAEGYFMTDAYVYDREGLPCKVCRTAIKRLVQGQRATYYCPSCQRT
ncbi:MAG TPA: bifunctional DNA-formamidopyrimidine glycosylase/DNA-(apurinic or apyrimidinic site) lyase [Burkholderiaceae bacterium]|nr:bifunctional DNA-formamidopyrimidine glycosylase/DNA-(apurinic or apyrimidinic site) lyase [Burkholderiaceae bacterium]